MELEKRVELVFGPKIVKKKPDIVNYFWRTGKWNESDSHAFQAKKFLHFINKKKIVYDIITWTASIPTIF